MSARLVLAVCLLPWAIACGGDTTTVTDTGPRHDAGFFHPGADGSTADGGGMDATEGMDAVDTDTGSGMDANPNPDATEVDTGADDSGAPDSGDQDAGLPGDTGVEMDAGSGADTGGGTDTGGGVDTGSPDAGVVDSGPADTGAPDVGMDAGSGVDAMVVDAGSITQGGGLMITEFLANTSGSEWIEVFNSTGQAVNLANYTITIASKGASGALAIHAATDPTGTSPVTIAAGGYLVGAPNPASAANIPAVAGFVIGAPGALGTDAFANGGDVITLRSPGGAGDALDFRTAQTTPGANVAPGQFPIIPEVPTSLDPPLVGPGGELGNDNGSTWCAHVFRGGSPGLANRPCTELVISEVLYDYDQLTGAGNDDGQEFIEIAGPAGGSLANVYVAGIEGSATGQGTTNGTPVAISGTRMPLDGLYVVADQLTGMTTTLVPNFDQIANFDLENGPDCVQLYRQNGANFVGLDAIGYGAIPAGLRDTTRMVAAVEGTPVADPAPTIYSITYARADDEADTNNNVMDFRYDPSPTPGQRNGRDQFAVTAITPSDGVVGRTATITISGVDFTDDMRVSFVQTPAPSITCPNPPPAVNSVRCTVSYPGGGSGLAQRVDVTVQTRVEAPRSVVVTGGFTWTTANNETNVASEADYAVLQHPPTLIVAAGMASANVYGRIYEAGRTDTTTGGDPSILAQAGWGASGSDPRTTNWTWTPARFNLDIGNNDEYQASLTAPTTPGVYAYTYRFSLDGGLTWTYADLDGAGSNPGQTFSSASLGAMTVN
ncbi:MAG: lamin tail domain-containing protein [Myxococcota bacterium]